MLIGKRAQRSIPMGGITGDDVHIWDADLRIIDDMLTDDEFEKIVWRSFKRSSSRSPRRGRAGMALNRVLRTGVLKHVKNWSFRGVFKEIQRNLDYRSFTQFFADETRKLATIARNVARIDAQTLRELNERLCTIAQERGVIHGRAYRQDTTVCETNIHYPTDSSLLNDGVRVLQRVIAHAKELVPSVGPVRDRSRSVRRRVIEIARSARGRGEVALKRRETSYRKLLRIVRPVVTTAKKAARKLGDCRVTRHLSFQNELVARCLKAELDAIVPHAEGVIRQTRARICRGVTNYPDKLLSLFEPKTCVIRKGKPHKPNEFGRLIDIVEVENGFVSDYQVLDGNPSDGEMLIPAIERHKQRFDRAPHTVATDAGFWSVKNEQSAYKAGVKRVSIPYKGKLSTVRRRIQRSRWFRKAQRWRANGEGRIGILKNVYGLDRCMYKGDEAMERWVGWCVFANNLVVIARTIPNLPLSQHRSKTRTPHVRQLQGRQRPNHRLLCAQGVAATRDRRDRRPKAVPNSREGARPTQQGDHGRRTSQEAASKEATMIALIIVAALLVAFLSSVSGVVICTLPAIVPCRFHARSAGQCLMRSFEKHLAPKVSYVGTGTGILTLHYLSTGPKARTDVPPPIPADVLRASDPCCPAGATIARHCYVRVSAEQ